VTNPILSDSRNWPSRPTNWPEVMIDIEVAQYLRLDEAGHDPAIVKRALRFKGTTTPACCMACGATFEDKTVCPKCRRFFSPSNHRIEFTNGALTGRRILAPSDFHISSQPLRLPCINGDAMIEDVGRTLRCVQV
jgi:hypothetical protein